MYKRYSGDNLGDTMSICAIFRYITAMDGIDIGRIWSWLVLQLFKISTDSRRSTILFEFGVTEEEYITDFIEKNPAGSDDSNGPNIQLKLADGGTYCLLENVLLFLADKES